MIKLICFDFDGTIANTMPWLEKNAVSLFTEYYGLSVEDATHEYRTTTGLPFEHQVAMIFPDHPKNDAVIHLFEKRKMEKMDEQELFPETKVVLAKLEQSGFLLAVSSSTTKPIIEAYTKNKLIHQYLNEIVGFYPGFEKGKHHFDYLMSKFALYPDDLLYIGDSLKDMERAYNSGIKFIGRLGPMFKPENFHIELETKEKIYFPTIKSLNDILDKLYSNDL